MSGNNSFHFSIQYPLSASKRKRVIYKPYFYLNVDEDKKLCFLFKNCFSHAICYFGLGILPRYLPLIALFSIWNIKIPFNISINYTYHQPKLGQPIPQARAQSHVWWSRHQQSSFSAIRFVTIQLIPLLSFETQGSTKL